VVDDCTPECPALVADNSSPAPGWHGNWTAVGDAMDTVARVPIDREPLFPVGIFLLVADSLPLEQSMQATIAEATARLDLSVGCCRGEVRVAVCYIGSGRTRGMHTAPSEHWESDLELCLRLPSCIGEGRHRPPGSSGI